MDMKILGNVPEQARCNLLRELFVGHMVTKLTDEALNAIRPRIVEYAKQAVREMEPHVAAHFDEMGRNTVIQLAVKEPK